MRINLQYTASIYELSWILLLRKIQSKQYNRDNPGGGTPAEKIERSV